MEGSAKTAFPRSVGAESGVALVVVAIPSRKRDISSAFEEGRRDDHVGGESGDAYCAYYEHTSNDNEDAEAIEFGNIEMSDNAYKYSSKGNTSEEGSSTNENSGNENDSDIDIDTEVLENQIPNNVSDVSIRDNSDDTASGVGTNASSSLFVASDTGNTLEVSIDSSASTVHSDDFAPSKDDIIPFISEESAGYAENGSGESAVSIMNMESSGMYGVDPRPKIIFKGIMRNGKSYRTQIASAKGEQCYLGTYPTQEEAAFIYDKKGRELFGYSEETMKKLNFNEEQFEKMMGKYNNGEGLKKKVRFKGVYIYGNLFRAQISVEGKTVYLGTHTSEEEAAFLYDKKARELCDKTEYKLNFCDEEYNVLLERYGTSFRVPKKTKKHRKPDSLTQEIGHALPGFGFADPYGYANPGMHNLNFPRTHFAPTSEENEKNRINAASRMMAPPHAYFGGHLYDPNTHQQMMMCQAMGFNPNLYALQMAQQQAILAQQNPTAYAHAHQQNQLAQMYQQSQVQSQLFLSQQMNYNSLAQAPTARLQNPLLQGAISRSFPAVGGTVPLRQGPEVQIGYNISPAGFAAPVLSSSNRMGMSGVPSSLYTENGSSLMGVHMSINSLGADNKYSKRNKR